MPKNASRKCSMSHTKMLNNLIQLKFKGKVLIPLKHGAKPLRFGNTITTSIPKGLQDFSTLYVPNYLQHFLLW